MDAAQDHDLLIRLDEKVTRGFESLNKRLEGFEQVTTKRIDDHDVKISDLKSRQDKMAGVAIVVGGIFGIAGTKILHVLGG